jgi:hypothetical protein
MGRSAMPYGPQDLGHPVTHHLYTHVTPTPPLCLPPACFTLFHTTHSIACLPACLPAQPPPSLLSAPQLPVALHQSCCHIKRPVMSATSRLTSVAASSSWSTSAPTQQATAQTRQQQRLALLLARSTKAVCHGCLTSAACKQSRAQLHEPWSSARSCMSHDAAAIRD